MKDSLKIFAKKTPLYALYRSFYDRYKWHRMNQDFWQWSEEDEKRSRFYQQFVTKGCLVIDVGANLGNRAKVFSKLGAVVVAIEPQTKCANFLQSVFQNTDGFHLIRKALGGSVGEGEIMISDSHTLSSLSSDWINTIKNSGRFSDYEWNKKETVLIDTLDNIIDQFSIPAFIKIDVEGFENEVLSGLSKPFQALSIEFAPEFMENTFKCIEHLVQIGECEFQMSIGESMEFDLPDWVKIEEIKKVLMEVPSDAFGDLYVKLNI